MFFNIEFHPLHMTPEDLLRVEPEVLAKLILHKRERISHTLPKMLESVGTEKQTAEQLARRSRDKKADIEPKFNNLIKERNELTNSIPQEFNLGVMNATELNDFNQLLSRIQSEKTTPDEFLQYLKKLSNICSQHGFELETLRNYNSSIKANQALSELSNDYKLAMSNWNENESHRRKLESKFTKLSANLKNSDVAIAYWQEKLNSNFDELLIDAKRVADGGPSSRQLSRNKKRSNNLRRS